MDEGPKTKRAFHVDTVPDGTALVGHIVDHIGQPLDATMPGTAAEWPLFRNQQDIEAQEDVHEALYTGIKVLTCMSMHGRCRMLGQPGMLYSAWRHDIKPLVCWPCGLQSGQAWILL